MAPAAAEQQQPSPSQPLDLEGHRAQHLKRSGSRASLPLSVQPSTPHSESATREGDGRPFDQAAGADDDYSWGPQHPCFPHPNPHVPLDSALYRDTRIIRVKRDWMVAGDLAPTFANLYPEVLDPLIAEDSFRTLIRKINGELVAAYSPWTMRAWVDAVMGVATGWLWEDLGFAGVKSRLRRLEEWIERWNRGEGAKEGVEIVSLRRTGYMTLDFQIPDPHIGIDNSSPSRVATAATPTAAGPAALDSARHGDVAPYREVQDLGTLRAGGQQHLSRAVAVGGP